MKPDEINMAADRLRNWINEQRLDEIDAMRVIALVMGDMARVLQEYLSEPDGDIV